MSNYQSNASTMASSTSKAGTPCPHNYPVAVTEPGLGSALNLAKKTLSFAWYRYVEWVFLSAIMATVLSVVIGLCVVTYMYVHKYVSGAVLLGGMAALIFWVMPFIERQAFLSHCGHIAVLTNLITKGDVGNGSQKMFKFGRELALSKLGELDTIWEVHGTIRSAVRHAVRTLDFIDAWLPMDLSVIKRTMIRVLNWAMPYVDAVVLSYGLARGDENFGSAGLDGMVYSIQNAKSIIKTALGAWLWEKVILGPVWLASAVGIGVAAAGAVLSLTGADMTLLTQNPSEFFKTQPFIGLGAIAAGFVFGPLFAHLIVKTLSEAFVRPMLIAMVMIKFHVTVRNQPLDSALQTRLVDGNESLANISSLAGRIPHMAV